MAIKTQHKPRQKDYSFDLEKVFNSIVSVQSSIPGDAFTAPVLGTERGGNGIVIKDNGIVLTIGYLVTEAETIWLTDHTGAAVQGHVLGYDQESGLGLIQALGKLNAEVVPIGRSSSLKEADKVVVAGFGGQKFIEKTFDRLIELKSLIDSRDSSAVIEIDGGVDNTNSKKLKSLGADILVAGSYILKSSDINNAIDSLK